MKAIQKADRIAASLPDHFALSRILVRQEAVNSSSMEGTHSTLDAVLEAEEAEPGLEPDEATVQVRDYAIALEDSLRLVMERGRDAFSLKLIERLHASVMAGDKTYKDVPGKLRERVVWIGGGKNPADSDFNPPPPRRVRKCLEEHIAYLRTDGMQPLQQSIILRLAIAHAHFEAIHPFRDGNGRVGRLLLPLMMAADGHAPLYLAPYVNINKPRYVDGLKAAQQRLDYAPLVNVLSDAIIATVREAEVSIDALQRLLPIWRARRKFRGGSAALRALDLLMGFPVITARRLSEHLGITFAAANKGIAQLVEARILRGHGGKARGRIFIAPDVLRIFNRTFGDEPIMPKA
jgi:Fic family protein